jgi:hypothetical protein
MAGDPVLVLQMQRMGDLIMSFPLLLWLGRCYPGRELHVVAEEGFFAPLMPLSPPATYISWRDVDRGALSGRRYRLLANLSIRPEAARLAGELEAEIKVGPVRDADGILRVRGAWQLYRASLTGGSRHNRFHWADLNALDMIPLSAPRNTFFDQPRTADPECDRVGLFVGASEPGKRPDAAFYDGLVRELLARGLKPVLLGGPADRPVAAEVRRLFGRTVPDLTGKLSLAELSVFGRTLALMIAPDTGPMHLAAWTGLRTLNLSVGHVNPWETGPYQPGHLVLRSSASCARGCWDGACGLPRCREALRPRAVAAVASLAAVGARARLARMSLPGITLFETARNAEGLFTLSRQGGGAVGGHAADLAGEFWRRFFLWRLPNAPEPGAEQAVRAAWEALAAARPELAAAHRRSLPGLARKVARLVAGGSAKAEPAGKVAAFWRPLAAYLDMWAQNEDASPAWLSAARDHLAALESLL